MNLDKSISNAIDYYLETDSTDKFMPIFKEMFELWVKLSEEEQDFRNGFETYGYSDDNYYQMMYISDRWKCAYRLKWILDGIEHKLL